MTIKLHVFPLSPRAFKVLFAANQLGIDYQMAFVDLPRQGQKTANFAALNPNMRMPVLEDGGYTLWESNAIVQYLAELKPESGLLPSEAKARLSAVKWQFWESAHWDPACAIFMFERFVKPLLRLGETSESEVEKANQMFARLAPILDAELSKHRYLAGETLTVADISVGASLSGKDQGRFPLEPYRSILRWHEDLKALPGWQKAVAIQAKAASSG